VAGGEVVQAEFLSMRPDALRELLERFQRGELRLEEVLAQVQVGPVAELAVATVDLHRSVRCGFPEVVFCLGKRPEWIEQIVRRLREAGHDCLCTRVSPEQAAYLLERFPEMEHNELARTLWWPFDRARPAVGHVVIVCAGTSDLPVAEEAKVTAQAVGCQVTLLVDVGVAGLHRLLRHLPTLVEADAIVVVAGMEGALPSVVGGLVSCPVIAVPTSVGYGAHQGGLTPLHAMLTSCAANVAVVNVDSGFNGGYVAALIARRLGVLRQELQEPREAKGRKVDVTATGAPRSTSGGA
jgi:NCAIR mutase (PurE)-related protein